MTNSRNESAPKVSVVVPTWDRCDLAAACLTTLRAQRFQDFEVIVVDDGSTDGTAATLARDFAEARVISLEKNRGFAVAVNAGIRAARGEWLFLLNNDMVLAEDCLELLVTQAEARGGDMAAPLVLWQDEPHIVYSAGDLIRVGGRPESHGFRAPRDQFQAPESIFGVSAGAGLYRRAIFDAVGLLDESFGAYFEDSDLCFRARLAGFSAVLVAEAEAFHKGSATIAGRNWRRTQQCYQNHALLVLKNMPLALLLRYAAEIYAERLNQTARLFSALRADRGALRALRGVAKAKLGFWLRAPGALRARWKIQRRRTLSNQALDALLTKDAP